MPSASVSGVRTVTQIDEVRGFEGREDPIGVLGEPCGVVVVGADLDHHRIRAGCRERLRDVGGGERTSAHLGIDRRFPLGEGLDDRLRRSVQDGVTDHVHAGR